MRPFFYSSYCLVQCARRMFVTKPEFSNVKTSFHQRRKAIDLRSLVGTDLYINKKLSNNESIEDKQWGKVRKELLDNYTEVNEVNVDSQVYDICLYFDRVDQGINYYKFLERNKYPLNLATMTMYLKLMGLKKRRTESQLTEEEEKSIIKVYNKIKKEYELLDPNSACSCIDGISLTRKWDECFKLLEMIKCIQNPGVSEMSLTIAAAFRNDKVDIGWKMMDEFLNGHPVRQDVYTEYLNYCKRNFSKDKLIKEVEKMFFIWQKYNITPHQSTIEKYEELLQSMGSTSKMTTVTSKGICQHCKTALKPTLITQKDFKVLSSAILNKLIVGKDVYRNTTPQELKNYMCFLQTMKPYDVVIDGLNVAYASRDEKSRDRRGHLDNVLQVVDYFRKRNKRTLVVGRIHMKWWSKTGMKNLEDVCDVFYTKNLSQDDPFLLHVTLWSGSQTCFVSRDFMRQHAHKIEDPAVKQLFKDWQLSHQYFFQVVPGRNNRMIKLIEPLYFDPSAQKNNEGWHVPFTTNANLALPVAFEAPKDWWCLKYKKQEKS